MSLRNSCCLLLCCVSFAASSQDLNDPGLLWSQSTLYRDDFGVPHIYADNLRAMAFAFGYAQADDHIERMLIAYRAANGRTSEVFGEAYAAADEFALKMAHGELARAVYGNADFATRDLCEGFALGVNRWLVQNRDRAPAWAEGIQPADVLALLHYYLMSQAPFDFDRIARRPRGTPSANAWAVAPSASETGEAMLVINPHTDYGDVFQWYEAHLVVEDMNFTGATLFGLPFLLQGHNEFLGWGLTPNEADSADVYVEPRRNFPRDPGSVMNARTVGETALLLNTIAGLQSYYVRTANGMEERSVVRRVTPRGPIVAEWAGRSLSYKVGGYGQFGTLAQLVAMARSESLAQFQAALTMHQLPTFHVVYADREGNIFYLYNTRVGQKASFSPPIQNAPESVKASTPWDSPVSAGDTNYQWGAIIPPAYLPFWLNPPSGIVQACGTPPWRASLDTPEWSGDYLSWLARDRDSYRAKRVRQLLGQGSRSFEDMQTMLFDTLVPFAVDAAPFLVELAEQWPEFLDTAHPDVPAALDMLRDWNHLADPDSAAMTIFHAWWGYFRENLPVAAATNEECYALLREGSVGIRQHALRSLSEAVRRVRNEYQSLSVPWGEAHVLVRGDRELPFRGASSGEPIFVAEEGQFNHGRWPVSYGYGFAMAVRFSRHPESLSIVPFGASEVGDSPHFDDQLDLFAAGKMKPVRFTRMAVEQAARDAWGTRMLFRPAEGAVAVQVRAARPVHARVDVQPDAPGIEPPSFTLFSQVISPIISPADVPAEVIVEFTIPEAMCAANNLGKLGVYAYRPATGWVGVADQRLDGARRTLIARVDAGVELSVLGPTQVKRSPVMLASVDATADAAPVPLAPRAIVPAPKGYQPPRAESLSVDSTGAESTVEAAAPATSGLALPLPVEPEVEESVSAPAPASKPVTPRRAQTDPANVRRGQGPIFVFDVPEKPVSAPSRKDLSFIDPRLLAQADRAAPEEKATLSWSNSSFKDLRGKVPQQKENLFLVPDGAFASPMVIGTELTLRPPVRGALFHVTTGRTVRAQVLVEDTAPSPLPAGLAAFTHFFSIEYESRAVPGRVALSMQLEPGVCASGNVDKLSLYTYDEEAGWAPLAGVELDAAAGSASGLDFALRCYAILGPAEYLQRPPNE